jgi:hypothetical protein
MIAETGTMIKIRVLTAYSLLGFGAACGNPDPNLEVLTAEAASETTKDIGDHVVHFNAMTTDQLPAEIAREYKILRSRDRAMLNVSVIAKRDKSPVPATVVVKTANLTGQMKNVSMRRVDEQEAIYYIGETSVANRETLIFDILVTPEGVDRPTALRFKREFYTDWEN